MGGLWPPSGGAGGGGGGGGISGLTPGTLPLAASSSTLSDSVIVQGAPDQPGRPSTIITQIDGGSTSGNGAINIRPSSGYGNFGAFISFDNQGIDGSAGGSILWNIGQYSSATTYYQKWFAIAQGLTKVFLISDVGDFYLGDSSGEYHDSKLTVGGNIKLTMGGKILNGAVVSAYAPAIGADWTGTPPADVADALDRIALWIQLNGGGPLP